ncbi:hypothetical protein JD969_02240 [Planctomycetota bacterium]|nr:hypothetical protein JD969_02240 [Planctomycetota bacterium]
MIEGLKLSVDAAKVLDCNSFQTEDGEAMAYVKLAYFGGITTILVDPMTVEKFMQHKDKMVKAEGALWVEQKPKGVKVKFDLANITAIK